MNPAIQDTLLQLFEHVRQDPDTLPTVPVDDWQEGSIEWRLLSGFQDVLEQLQQRTLQSTQMEQQLRDQESLYHSAFAASNNGLLIADNEDGRIIEVNPAACTMYGYTYEEMIGLQGTDLFDPDSHPQVEKITSKLSLGGFVHAQLVARRKDGTTFHTDRQATTFTYKGKLHRLAIVRDVTERVQAEEQLHEKEEQYRSVFECNMFGYPYEEIIGLHTSALTVPEYLPVVTEALETIISGDQYHAKGLGLRKDGTMFHVEAHSTPFTYKGKPHLLGVTHDITERVQAEEQLREKEEQYRSIFEATTDGLIIRNMDGFVVEANPAACSMHGYAYEEFLGLHRINIVHPEHHALVAEYMRAIQAGHTFQGQAVDLRKDGTAFPVEVRGSTFMYLGKPHTLSVLRDITERVQAEEHLREKEAQYRGVFEAASDAMVITNLDGFVIEANPAACTMYGYTYEELLGLHRTILTHREYHYLVPESIQTIKAGGHYQARTVDQRKDGTPFPVDGRGTPFIFKGQPTVLAVIRDITEQVQAEQLLEQRVEDRTRELSSLLEISHTVASTLQLKPLLGLILDQLKTVVDYTGSAILTVEGEDLVFLDNRGPVPEAQLMLLRFPLKNLGLIWETITSRESIIMQDIRKNTPLERAFRVAIGDLRKTTFHHIRACMIIPLTLKEQAIGMLVLLSSEKQAFTPHHATLALAIANQAAIAIENARLYEQAQELAALEERQRLARELHDSVSQALYGIALGAHTARTLLDRDPTQVAEPLDYVLSLAEAGLAEMRALIFELRPESLEIEGLVSALTKQGAALHARHDITVQTDLSAEPALPLKVKQELYRIAQEALHNTVKHAHASKVDLRLCQTSEAVILEVRDNGRGFDATASFPGHLGLHSMQERVKGLGGVLQIESAPGQGTCVRAQVPVHDTM
ncbi:MAG: PAS domain S-box protein [Chloroflexi bacterium]|nr:MAG: PAS domain S-box protein [Chloroflexota bacterium]